MGENKTIYSEKTLKAIKEFLLNGTYPNEISSLETVELRKQRIENLERSSKRIKDINL